MAGLPVTIFPSPFLRNEAATQPFLFILCGSAPWRDSKKNKYFRKNYDFSPAKRR